MLNANCDGNMYLPFLHLKSKIAFQVQEKLHCVTGPLGEPKVLVNRQIG